MSVSETCWSTVVSLDGFDVDIGGDLAEDSTALSLSDGSEDDSSGDAALFKNDLFPANSQQNELVSKEAFAIREGKCSVCPCCQVSLETDSMLVFHAHVKTCFVKKRSSVGESSHTEVPITTTIDSIRASVSQMDVRERINFMESLARLATMSARQRFHRRTTPNRPASTTIPGTLSMHEESASECEEEAPEVGPTSSSKPSPSSAKSAPSSSSFSPPKITETDYRVLSLLCSDSLGPKAQNYSLLAAASAPLPSPTTPHMSPASSPILAAKVRPMGLSLPPSPLFSFSDKSSMGSDPLVSFSSFSGDLPADKFAQITTPEIGPSRKEKHSLLGYMAAPTPTNTVVLKTRALRKRKALSFSPRHATSTRRKSMTTARRYNVQTI